MAADNIAPPALPLPPPMPATAPSPPVLQPALVGGPGVTPPVTAPPPPPQHYDPALDPAIKQLLDQQAEIQARLAALLPQKYGPNVKVELEMLRHKLRVLRAYADDHRELLPALLRLISPLQLPGRIRLCPLHLRSFSGVCFGI